MIAYNNEWLNNLLVRKQAGVAMDTDCISKEERGQVYMAYPAGFYTPNIFIRIGLFILTMIIVQFSLGLVTMLFLSASHGEKFGGLFIFFGLFIYAGLEFIVSRKHYKSGVDDALMWMSAGAIIGGVNGLTTLSPQANAIFVFIIALFLFMRLTNAIMAAVAALAFLAVIFLSLIKLGAAGKAITPFVIMIVSAAMYFLAKDLMKPDKYKNYASGLLMISITALVCLYAAGNYFVVREASVALLGMDLKEGERIPFGWLFWIFTIAIPILYIIRGVQKKDAVLLRVGLLLVAAIVFTVRYYYHLMPPETAMVIGGILFILLAYALIKYLHEPKSGFTYKEQHDKFFMDKLHAESILIAQTFSGPQLPTDTGTQFGGGSGGGGGATGEF